MCTMSKFKNKTKKGKKDTKEGRKKEDKKEGKKKKGKIILNKLKKEQKCVLLTEVCRTARTMECVLIMFQFTGCQWFNGVLV